MSLAGLSEIAYGKHLPHGRATDTEFLASCGFSRAGIRFVNVRGE